jgi:hypothetical protein
MCAGAGKNFCTGQIVIISGIGDHVTSVATTQLYYYSAKKPIHKLTNMALFQYNFIYKHK